MSFLPLSRAQAPVLGTNGESHQVSYLPPRLHHLYPRDMCPELSPSGPVPSPQAHESQGDPASLWIPVGAQLGCRCTCLTGRDQEAPLTMAFAGPSSGSAHFLHLQEMPSAGLPHSSCPIPVPSCPALWLISW